MRSVRDRERAAIVRFGLRRLVQSWNSFFFELQPTATLAVVRIVFGLVCVGWTVTLIPDLNAFFSSRGILPHHPEIPLDGLWGPLQIIPGDGAMITLFVALLVGSICLVVGLFTRLAALLVFLGVLGFMRRDPWVFNSGDGLVRIMAFYLMLAPSGAALSVDRWRRARDRFWEFPHRAPWALRLIQLQFSILYISAVWDKVRTGPLWSDGLAVSYTQRVGDLQRFSTPTFNTDSIPTNLMTYGTLAVELSLGILIWNRRLRPWVIGIGIAFHLFIDYSIRVGFFSLAVIAGLLAFLPPDAVRDRILWLRNRVTSREIAPPGVPAQEPPATAPV